MSSSSNRNRQPARGGSGASVQQLQRDLESASARQQIEALTDKIAILRTQELRMQQTVQLGPQEVEIDRCVVRVSPDVMLGLNHYKREWHSDAHHTQRAEMAKAM